MGLIAHFFRFEMSSIQSARKIEDLLAPVVDALGYELVDVRLGTEFGRLTVRLLVDRPGGITVGECAEISREVGPHLEVADLIDRRYVLEVSSPGIQRPLKKAADFLRFQGERVIVKTSKPITNRKTFRGTNRGLDADGHIVVDDPETGQSYRIPLVDLRDARLDPELRF